MPNTLALVAIFLLALGAASATLPAQARELHVLHVFCGGFLKVPCPQGANPGSLIQDTAGNFYGTASYGGKPGCQYDYGCGTVFKMLPDGSVTLLYAFTGGNDGGNPVGRLTLDAQGNLYGAASGGGAFGKGVIFKLAPDGTESVLHTFDSDGSFPLGSLFLDNQGDLYGITRGGNGTVFKLTPEGDAEVLYAFCRQPKCSDGASPNEGLVADEAGDLYGTTSSGGTGGVISAGTVFEVSPDGEEKVLWNFCSQPSCDDGEFPQAGLVRDDAGNLYGTTEYGDILGTVFKLAPDGTETVLHGFDVSGVEGVNPERRLAMDRRGNLYGTTFIGGANDSGTAFKVTSAGKFIKLVDFPRSMLNASGLLLGSDGTLYGTTPYTLANALWAGGTVFALGDQSR